MLSNGRQRDKTGGHLVLDRFQGQCDGWWCEQSCRCGGFGAEGKGRRETPRGREGTQRGTLTGGSTLRVWSRDKQFDIYCQCFFVILRFNRFNVFENQYNKSIYPGRHIHNKHIHIYPYNLVNKWRFLSQVRGLWLILYNFDLVPFLIREIGMRLHKIIRYAFKNHSSWLQRFGMWLHLAKKSWCLVRDMHRYPNTKINPNAIIKIAYSQTGVGSASTRPKPD